GTTDCLQAVAAGRSETPLSGHNQGEAHSEVGAQSGIGRGVEADAGILKGSVPQKMSAKGIEVGNQKKEAEAARPPAIFSFGCSHEQRSPAFICTILGFPSNCPRSDQR